MRTGIFASGSRRCLSLRLWIRRRCVLQTFLSCMTNVFCQAGSSCLQGGEVSLGRAIPYQDDDSNGVGGMHLSQLILNNIIRLTERILLPSVIKKSSRQIALSDTINDWITKQSTLIKVAKDKQLKTDYHALVEYHRIPGQFLRFVYASCWP